MSASFHSDMDEVSSPLLRPRARPQGDRGQLRQQLRIIQEMLEDLEDQTSVGRRHTMEKVIGVLRKQIGRGLLRAGPRNELMLSRLVDELAREVGRPLPEVRQFRDHAEPLVALLMATT
jgi:hypothetical protein